MTVISTTADRVWSNAVVRGFLLATLGALTMGVLAQIPPIRLYRDMVPITLQTLGVLLLAASLGPRIATAALAEYLLLGFSGVPWFSGFTGGLPLLMGVTGGYLLAFPIAAFVSGELYVRLVNGSYVRRFAGALFAGFAGAVLILLSGTVWLSLLFFHGNFAAATLAGLLPFLLIDGLKSLLAAVIVAAKKV